MKRIVAVSLLAIVIICCSSAAASAARALFVCVDSVNVDGWDNKNNVYAVLGLKTFLESCGIECIELLGANATKANVIRFADGANMLLYSGHGFGYKGNPNAPYIMGNTNGLALADGLFTQDEIRNSIKLSEGAIVNLSGACYSCGYSPDDIGTPSFDIAFKRVTDYSYTFLSIGASAYVCGSCSPIYITEMASGSNILYGIQKQDQVPIGLENAPLRNPYFPQYPVTWANSNFRFTGNPNLTWEEVFKFPAPRKSYGTISGRVVNSQWHVIPNATIRLDDINITFDARDGHFIAGRIPAGIHTIYYDAPGYAEQAQVVEIKTDQTTKAPTCLLSSSTGTPVATSVTGEILGRVVNQDWQTIPGTCIRIDASLMPTNPAGEFRFTLVHPGTYTIYYDAPDYRGQTQVVEVKAGQVTKPPTVIMFKH